MLTERIRPRCTLGQKQVIMLAAYLEGISVSEFLRRAVLGSAQKTIHEDTVREALDKTVRGVRNERR